MRSVYWKLMLAFLAVILVVVGTVAVLAGRSAEQELRRYAFGQGGMWNRQVANLATYHTMHGTWEGIQEVLPNSPMGFGGGGMGPRPPEARIRIADASGQIVGDTAAPPEGSLSDEELEQSIPIEIDGQIVGYLLPSASRFGSVPDKIIEIR